MRYVGGPQTALTEVDSLSDVLDHYYLYHATRAELVRDLGDLGDRQRARAADKRALELTTNPAEQVLLRRRIEADEVMSASV